MKYRQHAERVVIGSYNITETKLFLIKVSDK